ncbi:gamma-glutamyl-gamma-aminobutyrate hydrolase family protein [Serratia sp. M24T3]|uniref:glutamine amidotransferase-related protein n=1 Tax=Serratia sp. M24T3 TaxID=932213 RepID=UPI00025B98F1|nr:gamma-glutamyl-gamma-aminobutyrate hydrolase family protein [Serratia sp. M24T3]EIC84089.1 CTP synthase [Serratia sp. M24T3]
MALTFVAHNTPEPALYGAMASVISAQYGTELAHLSESWDTSRYADACQHVTAEGNLVSSGLLWHERLNQKSPGKAWNLAELLRAHGNRDWVIPLGPSGLANFAQLVAEARYHSIEHRLLEVVGNQKGFQFSHNGSLDTTQTAWRRDSYGRLTSAANLSIPFTSRRLKIALIGTYQDQLQSYPATLAAIGDAAEALGLSVETVFIPPRSSEQLLHNLMPDIDGVILPGGSDMQNVAGQIRVAHYCLRQQIPTLGLCLGMQTMATAVIQQMTGSLFANLAEADPHAAIKTFVPLAETPGHPQHRLGDDVMTLRNGSRMAAVLGDKTTLRYNHRFQLNPLFIDDLEAYGLAVSGTDPSGSIADAIEYAAHPFYLGVQGHPELTSTAQQPHPLIAAFLQAAG